jgi:hypothetical protein
MNEAFDGTWGEFRRMVSPAGGFSLNLSTRQIQILKDVHDQAVDYSDGHSINIIQSLSRMGLVHYKKGSLHEITDPGHRLLSLIGVAPNNQVSLKNVV